MAPGYRPLPVDMNFTANVIAKNSPPSYDDIVAQEALTRAKQIQSKQAEMQLAQQEQVFAQQNKMREALQAEAQNGVDSDNILEVAKRIAGETGDYKSLLEIEKVQKSRKTQSSPLSSSLKSTYEGILGYPLPDDITEEQVGDLTYAESVAGRNRDLDYEGKLQRLTGTQVRPIRPQDAIQLGELEEFGTKVDNISNRYMPYISDNRGVRFLEAAINPNSEAARMKRELDLIATELASAYNGNRLSDLDFKTMKNLVSYNDLDTLETIYDRFERLKEFTKIKRDSMLNSLDRGRINIDRFREQKTPDDLANSLVGQADASDEAAFQAHKQAHLQKLRSGGR